MALHSTRACVDALERAGQLRRIDHELDPNLEIAEIQRRVYANNGPALLFTRVKGSRFPMVSNLFGTMQRAELLFGDTLESVRKLVELKVDPSNVLRRPLRYLACRSLRSPCCRAASEAAPCWRAPATSPSCRSSRAGPTTAARSSRCRRSTPRIPSDPARCARTWACTACSCRATATSPTARLACTTRSTAASACTTRRPCARGEQLRVNIFVGGPPAMTLAAVMPLPEGLPELSFAGALARRRVRLAQGRLATCCTPTPTSASSAPSIPAASSPRGRSAITSATTACSTTSRCCTSSTCTTARTPSGRSRWSAGRRRKTPSSAS